MKTYYVDASSNETLIDDRPLSSGGWQADLQLAHQAVLAYFTANPPQAGESITTRWRSAGGPQESGCGGFTPSTETMPYWVGTWYFIVGYNMGLNPPV